MYPKVVINIIALVAVEKGCTRWTYGNFLEIHLPTHWNVWACLSIRESSRCCMYWKVLALVRDKQRKTSSWISAEKASIHSSFQTVCQILLAPDSFPLTSLVGLNVYNCRRVNTLAQIQVFNNMCLCAAVPSRFFVLPGIINYYCYLTNFLNIF